MGKVLSEEEHQRKLKEKLLKIEKEWKALPNEEKTRRTIQRHEEQCQAVEKLFKYVNEYPLENQSHFEKKLLKIQEDINNGKNLRDVTDWDFLWLHLLKISNSIDDWKTRMDIFNCYEKASNILGGNDLELSLIFYELSVHCKKEATEKGKGKSSEENVFKNAIEIIKHYIPTFSDGIFEKVIAHKRIDLLGKCAKTQKYIIVELKKGCRDATNQLYSYDRLLGGGNILVSLTEKAVPIKHDGIIYLNLEQYKKDIKSLK